GELVDTSYEPTPPAMASVGPLYLGGNEGEEDFKGRVDEVRIYDRALGEGELEPNQGPDVLPPEITLSGALTEGLKEGTKKYPLDIETVDGDLDRRGSGVKSITISVGGEVADSVTQKCPETNCGFDYVWTFDQEEHGPGPYTVVVSAEDHAGNLSSKPLQIAVPNGSIPACSPNGEPVESTPDEVQELAGGGSNAVFIGSEGEKFEYRSAPSGFDPKKASNEELELYGYPPKPSTMEAAARAVWEETVGESTGSAEPGGCMGVSAPDFATASGSGSSTVRYSESHAGWSVEDLKGPSNQWRGAGAIYKVPKLRQTCTGAPAAHVAYVGVGGSTESSAFFQAGTNQPYAISKNSEVAAFTEFFRAGSGKGTRRSEQPKFENLNINPGDVIFVIALWKFGPEKAWMYVQNKSTGKKISVEQPGKESALFDGRRLEYTTAERPRLEGGRFQAQNFGEFKFRGAVSWVTGKGIESLGGQEHRVRRHMQRWNGNRPVGQRMVATSRISSNGQEFHATWNNCHP
ncbi:MAG TPA: G1 family glutamic endopeptidase, partial [Solirubrobacterales bacterium]|nr:G1 family glutamic endopeptidase [Solirubrobacterales bacterium]